MAVKGEVARGAFALRRKMLKGHGSTRRKILARARCVSASALWAIGAAHPHESLLKGANSVQLVQLK